MTAVARCCIAASLLLSLSGCDGAPTNATPGAAGKPAVAAPDFAQLLEKLEPAILNVRSAGRTRGSAFLVAEGYVLSALHVVEDAPELTVRMNGTAEFAAEVVATDDAADLALLRADVPPGWRPLPLAGDDETRLGEWLLVLGNPFGQGMTVSVGVAGSRGRTLSDAGIDGWIQTDASINPGNSGGPVLDTRGRVIGIATARVAALQGVGFVTPVAAGRRLLEKLPEAARTSP